jgi:hypothetical protein
MVLGVSGLGFPLTQVVIRAVGRPGAAAVEGVAAGLLVRDLVLVAGGALRRLQSLPATLLVAETAAALGATAAGLRLLRDEDALKRAVGRQPDAAERARRIAIGALFGLHTWRFRIYLSPTRGLRRLP